MLKRIFLILGIFLTLNTFSQNQVYQWQMDTYKNAEKARSWRFKKKTSDLWTRKKKVKSPRNIPDFYRKPSKTRHRGRR